VLGRLQGNRLVATSVAASLVLHATALGLGRNSPPVPFEPARVLSVVLEVVREPAAPRVEEPPKTPPPAAPARPAPRRERAPAKSPAVAPQARPEPERLAVPAPSETAASAAPVTPQERTPSSATATPPPPAAPREASSPPDFRAAYLDNPPPAYPRAARRRGEQGTALVRVLVSAEGLASRVELERSSGSNTLDAAALEGVKNWRFVPATRGGAPTAAWVIVPVVFRLAPES
jgi:protein TonB